MTTRREFLADISHRIRLVYLPKHSSWLNQIEIFFGITHRKCLRGGNFTSVADLESQLRQFIIYYNTTMAHPFNWTYTGKPLQKPPDSRVDSCSPYFNWTYTGKPLQKTGRLRFVPPHRRVKMQCSDKPPSLAL